MKPGGRARVGWIEALFIITVIGVLFGARRMGRAVGSLARPLTDEPAGASGAPGASPDASGSPGAADGKRPDAPRAESTARSTRTQSLAVLELSPDADDAQVRQAWRELARVWHPDRFAHDPALQARATARLAAINAAYEQLQRDAGRK